MTREFDPWYRDTRPGLVDAIERAVADPDEATDAVAVAGLAEPARDRLEQVRASYE